MENINEIDDFAFENKIHIFINLEKIMSDVIETNRKIKIKITVGYVKGLGKCL